MDLIQDSAHLSYAAKMFTTLKDESKAGYNGLLALGSRDDASLILLILQEHSYCFFRFEGKDLLNLHPAWQGKDFWGILDAQLPSLFLSAT